MSNFKYYLFNVKTTSNVISQKELMIYGRKYLLLGKMIFRKKDNASKQDATYILQLKDKWQLVIFIASHEKMMNKNWQMSDIIPKFIEYTVTNDNKTDVLVLSFYPDVRKTEYDTDDEDDFIDEIADENINEVDVDDHLEEIEDRINDIEESLELVEKVTDVKKHLRRN